MSRRREVQALLPFEAAAQGERAPTCDDPGSLAALVRVALRVLLVVALLVVAACGGVVVLDGEGGGGGAGGAGGGGGSCAPVACELVPEDPPAACPPGWSLGAVLACEDAVPQGCSAIGLSAPVCVDGSSAGAVLVCCCEGWGGPGYDCGIGGAGGAP